MAKAYFGLGFSVVALALMGACASGSPPQGVATVRTMEANGLRITYSERGSGVPVVFVHGSMNDHRLWEGAQAAIARQYHAISYTQRYFGPQAWGADWPKFGVGVHAADLAAFIRGLGAGPVHVVGWSYGASVGLAMAQQHPELVKSAFLYEPAHPTFVSDPVEQKALADDRATFAPAVQAARSGDQIGSASALLDAVDNRSGVFQTLPAAFQEMIRDNARTMPLLLTSQDPPPPITCAQLAPLRSKVSIARGETHANLLSRHRRCRGALHRRWSADRRARRHSPVAGEGPRGLQPNRARGPGPRLEARLSEPRPGRAASRAAHARARRPARRRCRARRRRRAPCR